VKDVFFNQKKRDMKKLGKKDIMYFGKYKGYKVEDILRKDAKYFNYRFAFLNEDLQKEILKKFCPNCNCDWIVKTYEGMWCKNCKNEF